MKFTTTLQLEGATATGLVVPSDIVEALGAGKKPAITVTINGYTYRNSIGTRGGRYLISVSSEIRKITGLTAGDEVEVEVELDTLPRTVVVPPDLAAMLAAEPEVKKFFDSLSFSNQQVHTLALEQSKTTQTRVRRLEKSMETLRAGRVR